MDDLTIAYRDEPVGSREATTPSVDSLQDFAALGHILLTDNAAPQHATFEDDYWVLGTEYKLFPDSPPASHGDCLANKSPGRTAPSKHLSRLPWC